MHQDLIMAIAQKDDSSSSESDDFSSEEEKRRDSSSSDEDDDEYEDDGPRPAGYYHASFPFYVSYYTSINNNIIRHWH